MDSTRTVNADQTERQNRRVEYKLKVKHQNLWPDNYEPVLVTLMLLYRFDQSRDFMNNIIFYKYTSETVREKRIYGKIIHF